MSPAPSRSCQSHLTTREMSPSENSGCSTTAGFVPPWCPAPWHRQESPPSTARPHSTFFLTRLTAPETRLSLCRPSPEHRLFSQKHAVQMACPPPEIFGNRNIVDGRSRRKIHEKKKIFLLCVLNSALAKGSGERSAVMIV